MVEDDSQFRNLNLVQKYFDCIEKFLWLAKDERFRSQRRTSQISFKSRSDSCQDDIATEEQKNASILQRFWITTALYHFLRNILQRFWISNMIVDINFALLIWFAASLFEAYHRETHIITQGNEIQIWICFHPLSRDDRNESAQYSFASSTGCNTFLIWSQPASVSTHEGSTVNGSFSSLVSHGDDLNV